MIHSDAAAGSRCASSQSSTDIAARPGPQKSLSSSMTGSPVSWPRRTDAVDFPAAPRPKTTTRFILLATSLVFSLRLRHRMIGQGFNHSFSFSRQFFYGIVSKNISADIHDEQTDSLVLYFRDLNQLMDVRGDR
jgi:hypothetical protein